MLRLILFRHAKAVPHGSAPDPERDLTESGRADAAAMGRYCAEEMLYPDLVLVSPAQRTRRTWEMAAPALSDSPVEYSAALYQADEKRLLDLVRATRGDVRTLMVVGHNPSVEDLARALVGHGDRYAYGRMQSHFPTAGVAVIDFPVEDWSHIERRTGRLDRFRVPDAGGSV